MDSIKEAAKGRLRHCKKQVARMIITLEDGDIKLQDFTDEHMIGLRESAEELLRYTHELNAYRNVYLNGKK